VSEAAAIPVTWTASDYNWRVKLPGAGYSSPVIWGSRVFVSSAIEENATRILRCLRTADGNSVWERSFESRTHPKHSFNSYASSSPAVDQDHVYFAWTTPEHFFVTALKQEDGGEAWRRDLGPHVSQHGFGTSPILFDDMVILANDQDGKSFIVALDRRSGEIRWKADRRTKKAAFSTPCLYRPEGGAAQLILTSWAHGIDSLDPYTGKQNWELGVFGYRCVGSPMLASGLIFASCGEGGVGRQMFAVRPGNPARGIEPEVAYEIKESRPYVCTPVAYGDLLFSWYDKGIVTCLHAPTGEIRWQERIGGWFFGSPVRVDDRIYCVSRQGEVAVLAASDTFKLLGRIDLDEPSHSTPAIADGVMYLRTTSHLMAIGGKK
jgi:outer membrane protein assembly factor BamB